MVAEHGHGGEVFHLVVFRRRGAVRIDMVDLSGLRPASARVLRMQPMMGLPSGLDRVRWKQSVNSPQPASTPRMGAPRATAESEAFQHERAGAFRHDETVAVLREWPNRACGGSFWSRVPTAARKRISARIDRGVGADAKRRVRFAAPDRLDAELDRRAPDAQAVESEIGEPLVPKRSADGSRPSRTESARDMAEASRPARRASCRHSRTRRSEGAPFRARCCHSISTGATARNSGPGNRPSGKVIAASCGFC